MKKSLDARHGISQHLGGPIYFGVWFDGKK